MYLSKELVLKIIREKPLNSTKLILMKNGAAVKTEIFRKNWDVFNFIGDLRPDNTFDAIAVASMSKPVFSNVKTLMDGLLLKAFFIIDHTEEKIPQNIEVFFRKGNKIKNLTSPFFLFNESIDVVLEKNRINAAAFFSSDDNPSSIAENIKLAEDAGYNVIFSAVLKRPEMKKCKNQIAEHLKNIDENSTSTILMFFKISAGEISAIEQFTGFEIISRDDLIITIFDKRADGTSGKLKLADAVLAKEKAQFRKKVTGLSRIKGGIGLKGPGETKEEERKRILKNKEKDVRKKLKNEFSRISSQMKYRKKSNAKTVAIVGYTNAGKSTLFNHLTNETISLESDSFFSSIDPKIKRISLFGKPLFLVDTVGFISNMTKNITDAFLATLEEIATADMVLHIIDSSEKGWEKRKKFIEEILESNGTPENNIFTLFSKSDAITIKHPVRKGFFYNSFNPLDITKIKKFIYSHIFGLDPFLE
ncbi:MAG TPA: GTPase HflX [bacterium]|nr:GTPase HflX [bacterium]